MSVMNQQLKDQYDSLYASKKDFYGVEPVTAVRDLCEYIFTGSVLDIGGGEGRNALYLAEKGFTVTVYDLSKIGIQKLQLAAKEKHLTIQTKVTDILSDRIEGDYDVVVNSFVLHHMAERDAQRVIKKAQKHTSDSGVHVLTTFSNEGGLYERNKLSGRFYPDHMCVAALYVDWEMLSLTTHKMTTKAKDKQGVPMQNQVVTLVARKC